MKDFTGPDMAACALVIVDMQNDFVHPDGSMVTEGAEAMLPILAGLVQRFRDRELPVLHVVRLYEQDGSNADLCRRDRLASGEQLVVPGTWGAQMAEGLLPQGTCLDEELLLDGRPQPLGGREFALYKPRWSAFFGTRLHGLLHDLGVNSVAVAGTWYPNCIHATIYDAAALDYRVIAVRDCIAGITEKDCKDLGRVCVRVADADGLFQ